MAIDNEIVDRLLADYKNPEDVTGENGVLRQLTKALMERGRLSGEEILRRRHRHATTAAAAAGGAATAGAAAATGCGAATASVAAVIDGRRSVLAGCVPAEAGRKAQRCHGEDAQFEVAVHFTFSLFVRDSGFDSGRP